METQAAFIANTQLPAQVVTEAPKSMDGGPSVTLTIRLIMQGKVSRRSTIAHLPPARCETSNVERRDRLVDPDC